MARDPWRVFFWTLAVVNIVVGVATAEAQLDHAERLQRQIDKLEMEVGHVERTFQASILAIEHRLTKLETLSESNRTLLLTILGSILALVAQAVAGWIRILKQVSTIPKPRED